MSHRDIIATAVIVGFLNSQPGEFTPAEIRRMARGFHCDTSDYDVEYVCQTLADNKQISRVDKLNYLAFAAHSLTRECVNAGTDWMPQGWKPTRLTIPGCEFSRPARSTDEQY